MEERQTTVMTSVGVNKVAAAVAVVLAVLGLAGTVHAQLHKGDWPQFGRTPNFHSFNDVGNNGGHAEWSYNVHNRVVASPAVGGGKVFVGSDDSKLYCFNQTSGKVLWTFATGNAVRSSPALAQDGSVVFGSYDGHAYRVSGEGKLLWKTQIGGHVYSPATIAADGSVLIGSGTGQLFRLNFHSGKAIWAFDSHHSLPMNSGPAIGDKHPDIVVVRSYDQYVYAVNFTSGELVWRVNTHGGGGSSACIVDDTVYIGSWDQNLYAINIITGKVLWTFNTHGEIESHPAYQDGILYVSSEESITVFALNATTGSVLWTYSNSTQEFNGSPSLSRELVFIGANDHNMHVLDRFTGELKFKFPTCANVFVSAAIADNGMVYFGCNTATLDADAGPDTDDDDDGSENLGAVYAVNPALHL
ncbi:hypothetical protein PTSG_02441 [Salpingoeca rosetta]|uniref:Pyrrolo-quinoline quinone repeat domain-containing protein n=1 Tax=Salpingoeca rosetta (strain ATCC 50818 / BSB-021) TaxID=946362 RepID=F2U278_SALR5|nr:uncharacterized protein PTSG_02441 [Salpingoeca rosetta]EGD81730.1 hypothetical protein PTSG_02441 [Salpingoeca rosetta]|eukprot:XP_004996934.1 hypothetical protein PTSG_02441 [Salpingoeca rosetta]